MKVFVTGATGYIGFGVVQSLRRHGHDVYGLVREKSKAYILQENEIRPVLGSIEEPESYLDLIHNADCVIHCAFEMTSEGIQKDKLFIDTAVKAKHFIYNSGVWTCGNDNTEEPLEFVKWRHEHEKYVLSFTNTCVIRPGMVFGFQGGLTDVWFDIRERSVEQIGDGENHISMIHVQDLGDAYRSAAEKQIKGQALNITNGIFPKTKEISQAVSKFVNLPIKIITPELAFTKYGKMTEGLIANQTLSNKEACKILDWTPKHLDFIENIGLYFDAANVK